MAHQFSTADIGRLDFVVGLDRRHQQTLRGLGVDPGRLALLRSFDPASGVGADVPDPYYGDDAVFDQCLRMIEAASAGLVASLAAHWDTLGVSLSRPGPSDATVGSSAGTARVAPHQV